MSTLPLATATAATAKTIHKNPPATFCPECNSLLRPVERVHLGKPTLAHLCHFCAYIK
jgi:hypothetical protein